MTFFLFTQCGGEKLNFLANISLPLWSRDILRLKCVCWYSSQRRPLNDPLSLFQRVNKEFEETGKCFRSKKRCIYENSNSDKGNKYLYNSINVFDLAFYMYSISLSLWPSHFEKCHRQEHVTVVGICYIFL